MTSLSDASVALRRHGAIVLAFLLAVVLFVVGTIHSPAFASPNHVRTILVTASFIGLVGFGQTLCILIGGIDLSIPATLSGAAVLTAFLAEGNVVRLWWLVPLVTGLGALVGLLNGLAVAYAGVPPIIMTLGMNGSLQGLLLIFTHGGSASAPPRALVRFVNGSTVGLPTDLFIWACVIVIASILLSWSSVGRRLYAIGVNPRAAFLAGVNIRRLVVIPYVISGICGVLAGLLLLGFLGQAFVSMGDDYLFASAVAVAVGGASILGGRGHYLGTVAGAIILTLIVALLSLFSLGIAGVQISYGVILLATVMLANVRLARR